MGRYQYMVYHRSGRVLDCWPTLRVHGLDCGCWGPGSHLKAAGMGWKPVDPKRPVANATLLQLYLAAEFVTFSVFLCVHTYIYVYIYIYISVYIYTYIHHGLLFLAFKGWFKVSLWLISCHSTARASLLLKSFWFPLVFLLQPCER